MLSDITEIRLSNENGELFRYRLPANILSEIPHSDLRIRRTYQDVIASYFHSMLPVIPFIAVMTKVYLIPDEEVSNGVLCWNKP